MLQYLIIFSMVPMSVFRFRQSFLSYSDSTIFNYIDLAIFYILLVIFAILSHAIVTQTFFCYTDLPILDIVSYF
jgi:hypothetical protein